MIAIFIQNKYKIIFNLLLTLCSFGYNIFLTNKGDML
jgi:hypothetical protein